MTVTAEQLLNQKVVEELHVNSSETDCRIHVAMHCPTTLQLCELSGEAPAQVMHQAFKHLAKVTVLEFEYIDVHEKTEVVMFVHYLLDLLAAPHQRLGFDRIVDLVEDRTQAAVDGRLVFADD